MMKPHKHADILRALADGHEIEWWNSLARQGEWDASFSAAALAGLFCGIEGFQYRIKPEKKWYRVAKMEDSACAYSWTQTADEERDEMNISGDCRFVCWITDRIYYE